MPVILDTLHRIRVGRSYRKSQIPLTSLASYQGDGARLRYGFLYGPLGIYFFFTCGGYIFAIASTAGSRVREKREDSQDSRCLWLLRNASTIADSFGAEDTFLSLSLLLCVCILCSYATSSSMLARQLIKCTRKYFLHARKKNESVLMVQSADARIRISFTKRASFDRNTMQRSTRRCSSESPCG